MESRPSESREAMLWSPTEEDNSESTDEQLDEQFPGLNKAHGFFNMIKKNQQDRDSYHQEMEEWKQARKKKMEREWRNEREPRRQRPSLALYRPPHQRSTQSEEATVAPQQPHRRAEQQQPPQPQQQKQKLQYQLEVELRPDLWRKLTVVCGEEEALVAELAIKYQLPAAIREALLHHMLEFRQAHFPAPE